VLVRRSNFRLANIERRIEILDGYLIAYLNIDAVIRIIRKEDDPKAVMMRKWKLTDLQAESILNMRLRALRKLEEIEIRQEHDQLSAEKKDLQSLLKDEKKRWQRIGEEIADIRKRFGEKTALGKRRTEVADSPPAVIVPIEALIEREQITVVCSEKGWVRAFKGHLDDVSEIRYKEGDREKFVLRAETTDKLLMFATNGRFYTIACDKLPGARGDGEPLKLMLDMGNADAVALMLHKGGRKFLVASSDGRGFVVPEDEVVAQTRAGKVILNVPDGVEARACAIVDGDTVAVVGENRKLLLFKSVELPEMTRGRGVILQRYHDGGLSDVKVFNRADGLSWRSGNGMRTETALRDWFGERGQAGRMPPNGFPRSNRFT
jgi:topoisomerase-4 subunit A